MLVQPINKQNSFKGKFEINPLFNKFKEELNPAQKDIFDNIIKRVEKEPDGRIFKFTKLEKPESVSGAEVGIFERKSLINGTYWIPMFCSSRKNAAWCFDQLNKMYKDIVIARFNKSIEERQAKKI